MIVVEVRPFRVDEDLAGLVAVHNAMEAAEGREPSLTAERLESTLNTPGLYRWVATAPGDAPRLAGYGVVYRQMSQRCYGDVQVHPDAAGIFDPDHPAATFANRYSAALSDVDDYQNQYLFGDHS